MENNLTLLAMTELIISIIIGVLLLYTTFKFIDKFIRLKHGIRYDNISFSIFISSIIFSVGYLFSDIKSPILNSIRITQEQVDFSGNIYLEGAKYSLLFFALIIVSIFLINVISFYLFSSMTKTIHEFEEIKNNNIAVAIISGVIIITISLIVKDSLYFLLDTFVPYPESIKLQ